MTREREGVTAVADGVLRIHRAGVNCYLIAAADGLTLVDAGLPGMWRTLRHALDGLGATPDDIRAVVLTHGHFDHVGLCDRLKAEHHVASHIHPADSELARHPYRYDHQAPRWRYPFRFPAANPLLLAMVAAGALWVEGTKTRDGVTPGIAMDVPGRPVPVWSPGHTNGHCGFLLADKGVLFTGDALVTLDPYTGRTGPRMVARAATADAETNLLSLDRLADTGARLVLPGHGAPDEGGIRRAVDQARRAGIA
ncbi:MBL fold metallo-hydrolase [Microbacterium timonense]|uniref:MBL fold metallo-hydrolase n=1 Tax=Microbacterium timonense TaxID=2086576 RepID=UPI000D100E43|nr:MBL fold metallo-hydrolase [Microbacterium timonense]